MYPAHFLELEKALVVGEDFLEKVFVHHVFRREIELNCSEIMREDD